MHMNELLSVFRLWWSWEGYYHRLTFPLFWSVWWLSQLWSSWKRSTPATVTDYSSLFPSSSWWWVAHVSSDVKPENHNLVSTQRDRCKRVVCIYRLLQGLLFLIMLIWELLMVSTWWEKFPVGKLLWMDTRGTQWALATAGLKSL